jgi:hypothetical protein
VNKAIKSVLEKAQDELVDQLCDKKYSRYENRNFKRAWMAKRTLETKHGTVEFKLVKVKSLKTGP